jgi:hypothetical protein
VFLRIKPDTPASSILLTIILTAPYTKAMWRMLPTILLIALYIKTFNLVSGADAATDFTLQSLFAQVDSQLFLMGMARASQLLH